MCVEDDNEGKGPFNKVPLNLLAMASNLKVPLKEASTSSLRPPRDLLRSHFRQLVSRHDPA